MRKRSRVPRKGKHAGATRATGSLLAPPASDEPGVSARLAPFLAFVVLLALYIATLNPSVAGGDSGELTAAALTGGVPHPSGYPLFALLARLFAAFPLGHSPAWRVNLLSAVSTAAAAGLVCAAVQSWTRNAAAGLLAAALFGTDPVVWSQATSAEVFGLNAMSVALAFWLWSRIERTLSRLDVFALFLSSGLAMGNHQTFVFVGAPLALRSLWAARRRLGAGGIALACACGLLGLLPYFYLMGASASAAPVSWGDQTSVDGLVALFLRRDYGTFSMGRPTTDGVFVTEGTFLPTLWQMWGRAFPRLLWLGPPLAAAGVYFGTKSRPTRKAAFMVSVVFCFYGLAYCSLSNLSIARPLYLSVLGRFCIESDLLLAIAAGFGFASLAQRLAARWPEIRRWRGWFFLTAAAVFAVGVVAHAGQGNARNNTVLRDFVTAALASLPPNAIVISVGDEVTNSAFYLHDVEQLRPDVIHLGRTYLAAPWYSERQRRLHRDLYLPEGGYGEHGWNIKRLLDGNSNRSVMILGHLDDWDQSWGDGYKLVTYGLVHALVRAGAVPSYREWAERDRQAIGSYDVGPALRAPDESWEHALAERVLGTQVARAHLCLVYSGEDAPEPARNALRLLEDVVAKAGGDVDLGIAAWPGTRKFDVGPGVWKDLGVAYEMLARGEGRYDPRMAVAYQRFVEQAASGDPDLPIVRRILEQIRQAPRGPW